MISLQALRNLLFISLLVVLTACQSSIRPSTHAKDFDELNVCINLAREFRRDVIASDANNASVSVLGSHPFLATNRFLSTLAKQANSAPQIDQWIQEAVNLGLESRRLENQVLDSPWSETKLAQLNSCSENFASSAEFASARQNVLRGDTATPEHYRALPQWLGFYPLLRPVFKIRIDALHRQEKRSFVQEEAFTNPLLYGLAEQNKELPYGLEEWFVQSYQSNPLQIPKLSASQLDLLFALHAPQIEVETLGPKDQLGIPTLTQGKPEIDTSQPVLFTLPSLTQFGGRNLLQLNYVLWFPKRGPVSLIDLYAGNIDSIIWRVTLDSDGQVLLYDSIHSCGCYRKYFLASDKVSAKQPALSAEPANLIRLEKIDSTRAVQLVISSNEHFIVGIKPITKAPQVNYSLADYSSLSTLTDGERTASLFSPTGIIPTSERLERFTLWPTGIESVGAMRQWGTHATGFVERQHFDDANGFDDYLNLQGEDS